MFLYKQDDGAGVMVAWGRILFGWQKNFVYAEYPIRDNTEKIVMTFGKNK
jgi:hypothetical protein